MDVDADFRWTQVVIGNELNAIRFTSKNKMHILCNRSPYYHSYECGGTHPRLPLEEEWARHSYKIYQAGRNPFSDKIKTIRVDKAEKTIKVMTVGETRYFISYDELYIFDLENVFGLEDIFSQEIIHYRVLDWFDIRTTGGEIDVETIDDPNSNFVKKICFFDSTRIDGERNHKDLVAESVLTPEEINDVNFTDTIARFKVVNQLEQIGIKKPRLELWKRDIYPIKKISGMDQDSIYLMRDNC